MSPSTTIAQDTIKTVVGVIENFHQLSFHNPIEPLVVGKLDLRNSSYLTKMIIKMENIQNLEMIRSEWDKLNIDMSFDYYFLDDSLSKLYTKETKLLMILIVCSVITIALSCFGVFSLISVILKNRTKELAIRRVVGSSFRDNYRLLSRPFMVILLTVFVLICPVTYYYIQIWREDYAYSLNFSALPFLGALLLIFFLIFFTLVSLLYKTYKVNITSLLRSE